MKDREVIDVLIVECSGAGGKSRLLHDASITIFNNGSRQVGCPKISSLGECEVSKRKDGNGLLRNCIHLDAIDSELMGKTDN